MIPHAYVTTEKKRGALDKLWRLYDRRRLTEQTDPMKRDHGSKEVRQAIERFVNCDGDIPNA